MRRERGSVLVSALLFAATVILILDGLAVRAAFAGRDADARAAREEGLHEARGGVREAAARLAAGELEIRIARSDEAGTLSVQNSAGRLVATFSSAAGCVRRVSALWSGGRLRAWEED